VPAWAGLLLAAVLVASLALILWQTRASIGSVADGGEYLLEGQKFDKSQLRSIVQALAKNKLTGYVIQQQRIRVPRGQLSIYHAALAEADALPGEYPSYMGEALEQSRIFESEQARQQRLRHARELDMAATIRSFEGIDDAMVQLDEIQQRGFQSQRLVTASVSIRPDEGHVLDRGQVRAIGRLVAGANAGMRPEDVIVTDLRSGISYLAGEANDAVGPVAEEYLRVKRAVERSWQQKLSQVLNFVPGVRVAVDAELDIDADQGDQTPRSLTQPKRLAVAVAVPDSYLVGMGRLRSPAGNRSENSRPMMAQQQLLRRETETQIRDALVGLLPEQIDTSSAVTVTTYRDLPSAPGEPDQWQPWRYWSSWRERLPTHRFAWVAIIVSGLIGGAITWLARRRPTSDEPPRTIPMPPPAGANQHVVADHDRDAENFDEGALRATLTELVRQDPDGAAEILHRWMDKAG
jgi:flagellar biosynthesis/type III secretory pathway M-ring protein FliF/YscJ